MSYFGMEALVKAAILGEENRRYAESTGLLRDGVIRPAPHLGPSSVFSCQGYLDDLVPMDDVITFCVQRAHKLNQKGPLATKRKKRRIRWHHATSSAGTPPAPGTKPP